MRADPRYTNPKPLPTPQKPGAQCGNYTICGTRFHPGAQGRGGVRRRSYPDIVGLYLLVIRLESVRIVRRGAVVLARLQWTQSVKHTRGGRRLFYPRRARPPARPAPARRSLPAAACPPDTPSLFPRSTAAADGREWFARTSPTPIASGSIATSSRPSIAPPPRDGTRPAAGRRRALPDSL